MYRLANSISNDVDLNLISEVSFNPSGTVFAVCYQKTNEVVVFDSHTRSVLRVYQNPDAGLDTPHGILLTDNHIVVSNTHSKLHPSSFTVYHLNDLSQKPVSTYETPYQHLREAHSLALHNNILVASYCENTQGPGAVVSYRFDDEAGLIGGPICLRESCFEHYGGPKGVAFGGDGAHILFTYVTPKRMAGPAKYIRRLQGMQLMLQSQGAVALIRHIGSRLASRLSGMQAPARPLKNGIAIFAISERGVLSEEPVRVLEREVFCRLENINIVGDTVILTDTINGRVYLHDLANDPQLERPVATITEGVTLPHGAKLSPDRTMLVVTNYALKISNQVIHWKTPAQDAKNSVLVYDLHEA